MQELNTTRSSHISDCPTCGSNWSQADQRLRHLEDAKWSYESAKGQGSFAKDHPKLHDQIGEHHKAKANIHVQHAKHIVASLTGK
jgi:hypothetical protein